MMVHEPRWGEGESHKPWLAYVKIVEPETSTGHCKSTTPETGMIHQTAARRFFLAA